MGDLANIQIGRQNITLDPDGTPVNLGHTDGGCEFSYEPEYTDIVVDAYGKTVADKVLVGEAVKVKVPLAEPVVDKLKEVIPTGTFVEDSIDPSIKKLEIGSAPGKKLSFAKKLLLHPANFDTSDKSKDITLHKAVVISEVVLPYKVDEKTVYEVEFLALVDELQGDGNYLATIGDPNATA